MAKRVRKDSIPTFTVPRLECDECEERHLLTGQAFTPYICALCHRMVDWHNTGVPQLCIPCARDNGVCIRCQKDIRALQTERILGQ